MSKCRRCGFEIPDDEEPRFCPNCGSPISTASLALEKIKIKSEIAEIKISFSKRVIAMMIFYAISFLSTLAGSISDIDSIEARILVREIEELRNTILKTPEIGTAMIFGNNMIHCLSMFIPVFGLVRGLYVLYLTGRALAALGLVYKSNPVNLVIATFIFPHALMEYLAYSIALSEGFWLIYVIVKGGVESFKHELNNTAKAISISTIILFLAAVVEMSIILG